MKINNRAVNDSFGRKSKRNQTKPHRGDWSPNSNQMNSIGAGGAKKRSNRDRGKYALRRFLNLTRLHNKPGAFGDCGAEIPDGSATPRPPGPEKSRPNPRRAILAQATRHRAPPQTKTPEIQGREGRVGEREAATQMN